MLPLTKNNQSEVGDDDVTKEMKGDAEETLNMTGGFRVPTTGPAGQTQAETMDLMN